MCKGPRLGPPNAGSDFHRFSRKTFLRRRPTHVYAAHKPIVYTADNRYILWRRLRPLIILQHVRSPTDSASVPALSPGVCYSKSIMKLFLSVWLLRVVVELRRMFRPRPHALLIGSVFRLHVRLRLEHVRQLLHLHTWSCLQQPQVFEHLLLDRLQILPRVLVLHGR